jgi:SnoaL-like protein
VPDLTPGDGQDLLAAYKRAWERRDVELAISLYAGDAEHRDHPFRDPYVGSNAIRTMWNDIAANEAHVEFDAERVWVVGRTVLSSWHGAYTDRTNGDRVRIRGFMTIEVNNERKITRLREWPVSRVVGKDSTYDVPANELEGGKDGRR